MSGSGPEASSEVVRVLVVDDQALVREGIAALLELQPGVAVVGTAASGEEAVRQVTETEPDVVLLDVRMPGMDGLEAARQIRRVCPQAKVVMLTTFDDEAAVTAALAAGAIGFVLKNIPAGDLAVVVRGAGRGLPQLDAAVVARLTAPRPAPTAPPHDLTPREREVLRLLSRGATNREIAAHLAVGEGTVKNHVSSILSRLGLRDRTQAAVYAAGHGLLNDPA